MYEVCVCVSIPRCPDPPPSLALVIFHQSLWCHSHCCRQGYQVHAPCQWPLTWGLVFCCRNRKNRKKSYPLTLKNRYSFSFITRPSCTKYLLAWMQNFQIQPILTPLLTKCYIVEGVNVSFKYSNVYITLLISIDICWLQYIWQYVNLQYDKHFLRTCA